MSHFQCKGWWCACVKRVPPPFTWSKLSCSSRYHFGLHPLETASTRLRLGRRSRSSSDGHPRSGYSDVKFPLLQDLNAHQRIVSYNPCICNQTCPHRNFFWSFISLFARRFCFCFLCWGRGTSTCQESCLDWILQALVPVCVCVCVCVFNQHNITSHYRHTSTHSHARMIRN